MSKRKVHPNSLKNLIHSGRPLTLGEPKKPRQLTVSETGWEGVLSIARELGCTGVSDLLERIGRFDLIVSNPHKLEDSLDLQDANEALAESEELIAYSQVRQELGLTSAV